MKKRLLACTLAATMVLGSTAPVLAADDGSTQGTNTFVDGGTDLSFWTFQELHVGFWTSMADEWNKQNPDRPINLTVTTGESSSLHSKLLIACQSGEGAPDMADIEIGHYGAFLKDGYLLPINDAVEPYKDDVVMSRISMYGDNEGNYYGVDFHLGATVAYYNMDIMNEAGIDPADIVTWDDYVEAGKTVLEKTGTPMCAVETSDLFFPQCMMLEKGAQYVDEDGNPNLVTDEHAEVIDYIRSMINDGVCEIAPGGGFHTEEWYGHLNGAGVASVIMPLWYMGRFTDYCPDLEGKMAIYPIPVWNEGDTREVLQGGTGTSVIKGTENEQLAKDFLAFAKLSKEGCTYEWEKLGFDPIRTELWDDPEITEIMVNGAKHIFYEKRGQLFESDKHFTSKEKLNDVIQQMAGSNNRMVNEASPIVDTRLANGSRVNIVLQPIAIDGSAISIRKFPEQPFVMENLIRFEAITEEAAEFLKVLVLSGYNIFVSGGTGSGKTTFLNALSQFIPREERIITIEDSAELQLIDKPNLVRLETRNANTEGVLPITIRDLIKTALRMRPNRVIVGECRGAEALDVLQAMNTGHDGSLSTGHANSCKDMLSRLETMVLMGMELPLPAIRSQIASGIDILIHLGRMRDKSRKVLSITEIAGYEENQIILNDIYRFKEEKAEENTVHGAMEKVGELIHTEKMIRAGYCLDGL